MTCAGTDAQRSQLGFLSHVSHLCHLSPFITALHYLSPAGDTFSSLPGADLIVL